MVHKKLPVWNFFQTFDMMRPNPVKQMAQDEQCNAKMMSPLQPGRPTLRGLISDQSWALLTYASEGLEHEIRMKSQRATR